MTKDNWAVFRQDFTGNEFLVEQNLSKVRAHELVIEYESHKHHQHYWACEVPETETDFSSMLKDLLNSGSGLSASLNVLRNQNASRNECIAAVQFVRGVDLDEAKNLVESAFAFKNDIIS